MNWTDIVRDRFQWRFSVSSAELPGCLLPESCSVALPDGVSPENQHTLSYFLHLQEQKTILESSTADLNMRTAVTFENFISSK